ncbi:MAG TPA: hypothetical protein VFG50_16325, partial [Rhodothermales bacterium]|nr:hypothetical protein [Rhodothermales bacterium]
VAKDKPFTTPAGTFRCYVYKFSFLPSDDVAQPWDVYRYYAPDVGNIVEIVTGHDDSTYVIAQSMLYEYRTHARKN